MTRRPFSCLSAAVLFALVPSCAPQATHALSDAATPQAASPTPTPQPESTKTAAPTPTPSPTMAQRLLSRLAPKLLKPTPAPAVTVAMEPVSYAVPAASTSPRAYARAVLGATQYSCANAIFTRESGWEWYARNPYSGAYGIPQALPGSKMASAGRDWRTNPITQVKWGIAYMKSRYGSACGAWSFWQRHDWY